MKSKIDYGGYSIKIAYRTLNEREFNAVYAHFRSQGYDFDSGTQPPGEFKYRSGYNRISLWRDNTLAYGSGPAEVLDLFGEYYTKLCDSNL